MPEVLDLAFDATPLLGPLTGVGEFCSGALAGLARRDDVAVRAFAVSWRRRGGIVEKLPDSVVAASRPMPARPLHLSWRLFHLPPIEAFVGRCDVVHGSNYVVPPALRAARVVTVHDLTTVRYPELADASTRRFPALVADAVRRGAWVHTPSEFVAGEVVEEWRVPPERVRAVHHGVPTVAQVGGASASTEVLGGILPPGVGSYLLFLGTVEPRKDLPTLLEAFQKLLGECPELWLVIAGREGWGVASFEKALDSLAIPAAERVVRTGYVSPEVRAALLSSASAFVYPSLYEGFGFPPLEAMHAGVPVVATRGGAIPEVVGDAALLVDPGDADGLAEAMIAAVTDEAVRSRLVASGRKRLACFSWDACAEGLARLYRDASQYRTAGWRRSRTRVAKTGDSESRTAGWKRSGPAL